MGVPKVRAISATDVNSFGNTVNSASNFELSTCRRVFFALLGSTDAWTEIQDSRRRKLQQFDGVEVLHTTTNALRCVEQNIWLGAVGIA
jgi:hypothetical protein